MKTHCIECAQPFKFGANVFTEAGQRETQISGMCERCFDVLFEDDGGDEEPCPNCRGDGRDPSNDYLLPCALCQGEQQAF